MTNFHFCDLDQNKKSLIKITFLYNFLLISWLVGPFHIAWDFLDIFSFRTLNNTLAGNGTWAFFWAYMNADFLDRLMEVLVFGLTFYGVYKLPGSFKKNLWDFFKYYIAFTLSFILVKWLIHKGLHIKRLSPNYTFDDGIRLKGLIPYKLKDASKYSFPADHALFLFLMYQYARRKFDGFVQKSLLAVVILFTLPRLFSGAHWVTDVFFGAWMPSAIFSQAFLGKKISASLKREDAPQE